MCSSDLLYDVVIRSNSGKEENHDYHAVNILGAIAAADMEMSMVMDEGSGMYDVLFGSLVIDEEKANGNLLFRLAESISTVVIHESVVEALNQKGNFGLTFLPPEEFCG